MKKTTSRDEGLAWNEQNKNGTNAISANIESESIDALAEKIVEKMLPVLFVCARVASRDTIRTPMKDLHAIFKDVVEEANVALSYFKKSEVAND